MRNTQNVAVSLEKSILEWIKKMAVTDKCTPHYVMAKAIRKTLADYTASKQPNEKVFPKNGPTQDCFEYGG